MSIWQTIYKHLKNNGIQVYSPGQHQGECLEPYVVLKDAGADEMYGFSSTTALYDVMCYVPKDKFSTLEPYVDSVKSCLKDLYPMIVSTHYQTPSYLDDTVKGHMISLQYRNSRKNTNL